MLQSHRFRPPDGTRSSGGSEEVWQQALGRPAPGLGWNDGRDSLGLEHRSPRVALKQNLELEVLWHLMSGRRDEWRG